MATTTTERVISTAATKPPRTKFVCFSFAAYARNLLEHLRELNVPILPGLNDDEFEEIESTFNFTFPPDLRSILQEGLPVGSNFPNWRSSSHQQLRLLLNLPSLSLSKNVSLNSFWSPSWGSKPRNKNDALSLVKRLMEKAPILVPIYRNCYIPSSPNSASNPVFYIDVEEVRVLSFDLAGFFKAEFFRPMVIDTPVWAAKEARRIQFWTDVAERGCRLAAGRWWSECDVDRGGLGLKRCLDEAVLGLRNGGWRDDEVRDMMVMDGCDESMDARTKRKSVNVVLQLRFLSVLLLNAGWSREDVVCSLNLRDDEIVDGGDSLSSCFDFQHQTGLISQQSS